MGGRAQWARSCTLYLHQSRCFFDCFWREGGASAVRSGQKGIHTSFDPWAFTIFHHCLVVDFRWSSGVQATVARQSRNYGMSRRVSFFTHLARWQRSKHILARCSRCVERLQWLQSDPEGAYWSLSLQSIYVNVVHEISRTSNSKYGCWPQTFGHLQRLSEAKSHEFDEDLTVVSTINSLAFSPLRYWLAVATDVSVEAKCHVTINSCSVLMYVAMAQHIPQKNTKDWSHLVASSLVQHGAALREWIFT